MDSKTNEQNRSISRHSGILSVNREESQSDTHFNIDVGSVVPLLDSAIDDSNRPDQSPLSGLFCRNDRPRGLHVGLATTPRKPRHDSGAFDVALGISRLSPMPNPCVLRRSNVRLRAVVLGNRRRKHMAPIASRFRVRIKYTWFRGSGNNRRPIARHSRRRAGAWHCCIPLHFHPGLSGRYPSPGRQDILAVCPHR